MVRNCKKGYSCGSSCISVTYSCLKNFSDGVSVSIDGTREVIRSMAIDANPKPKEKTKKVKSLGKGEFGQAWVTNKGTVIKEGLFGLEEVENMSEANKLGLAPKVASSSFEDKLQYKFGQKLRKGKVEMEMAKGTSVKSIEANTPENSKKILKALQKLNENSISHNDTHGGNMFIEGDNVQFIDFGNSRKGSEFALNEALRISGNIRSPAEYVLDRKTKEKLKANFEKTKSKMKSDGMSDELIEHLWSNGFATPNFTEDAMKMGFGKVSASKIKGYIRSLYKV